MAEFAPQYDLFKIIKRLESFGRFIFWLILLLSVAPIIFKPYCEKVNIIDFLNILNIICISLFFCIELIDELILIPQADNKRRDDFIDNSFGSSFSTKNSVGYYDNDHINKGLYKTSVNLFENCFITFSLVKATTVSKIIIPILLLLTMIVLAFYGFKEVPYALSVLQALFSANILGNLIKHFILLNRISQIQDNWITLFQNIDFKINTNNYQAFVYRYWLQYETLITKINAGIPESVFKKNNPPLTTAWEQLKLKYNIS